MKRRTFLGGMTSIAACCCTGVQAQEGEVFFCGVVDPPPSSSELSIAEFSNSAGIQLSDLKSTASALGLSPYGTASASDAWRRSDGLTPNSGLITLGVCFLDGTEDQIAAVESGAMQWISDETADKLSFRFRVPREDAQITVTFQTVRNSSIVGRASQRHVATRATMELMNVVDRVIVHEFGHALGLRHEHSSPVGNIEWNREQVIADMAEHGWTSEMVESNIFKRLSADYTCLDETTLDRDSIMLYPIPASWTTNGFSTKVIESVSARDMACIVGLYSF